MKKSNCIHDWPWPILSMGICNKCTWARLLAPGEPPDLSSNGLGLITSEDRWVLFFRYGLKASMHAQIFENGLGILCPICVYIVMQKHCMPYCSKIRCWRRDRVMVPKKRPTAQKGKKKSTSEMLGLTSESSGRLL